MCKHLQHGWFDDEIGLPEPVREPQDVLGELINNAVVGGNHVIDREFIADILKKAEDNRKSQSDASTPSFPKFCQLPAEIRKEIWLLSVPERTIHITSIVSERACWNRRLPIPAPALACHEAWSLIKPLMHEMFDSGGWDLSGHGQKPVRRVAWITPSDSLSLGPDDSVSYGWFPCYSSQLPVFKRIAASLSQIEHAVCFGQVRFCDGTYNFKFHTMKQMHLVIQTVVVSIEEKMTTDGMAVSNTHTPSCTSVDCVDVNCRTVEKLPGAPEEYYERNLGDANRDTHLVETVDLRDRRRLHELINLSSVMGVIGWTPDRRLSSLDQENHARCFDCLSCWWEHNGLSRAKEAVSRLKALEIWDSEPDGRSKRQPSLEEIRNSELLELVPTVRFLI